MGAYVSAGRRGLPEGATWTYRLTYPPVPPHPLVSLLLEARWCPLPEDGLPERIETCAFACPSSPRRAGRRAH